MLFKACTAGESGNSVIKFLPSSLHLAIFGSKGKQPRNGTCKSSHIFFAPPVEAANISEDFCKKIIYFWVNNPFS